jgi:hypothetical protein
MINWVHSFTYNVDELVGVSTHVLKTIPKFTLQMSAVGLYAKFLSSRLEERWENWQGTQH